METSMRVPFVPNSSNAKSTTDPSQNDLAQSLRLDPNKPSIFPAKVQQSRRSSVAHTSSTAVKETMNPARPAPKQKSGRRGSTAMDNQLSNSIKGMKGSFISQSSGIDAAQLYEASRTETSQEEIRRNRQWRDHSTPKPSESSDKFPLFQPNSRKHAGEETKVSERSVKRPRNEDSRAAKVHRSATDIEVVELTYSNFEGNRSTSPRPSPELEGDFDQGKSDDSDEIGHSDSFRCSGDIVLTPDSHSKSVAGTDFATESPAENILPPPKRILDVVMPRVLDADGKREYETDSLQFNNLFKWRISAESIPSSSQALNEWKSTGQGIAAKATALIEGYVTHCKQRGELFNRVQSRINEHKRRLEERNIALTIKHQSVSAQCETLIREVKTGTF